MMTPVAHLSLIQARRLALRSLTSELQTHSVPEAYGPGLLEEGEGQDYKAAGQQKYEQEAHR